jgi:Ni,Fe-hydrogenase III component G
LALSREELLKLSSKGLENFAQTVTANRNLTMEEERQLKRQRRLIKNRESAQLSRLRKKIYIEELERKVNHLAAENDNLAKQVAAVNMDKKKLQDEVIYLQSIIKQNPNLVALDAKQKQQPFVAKNVKAAGVCLLVVLFSFGLLFNAIPDLQNMKDDKAKSLYTGRTLKSSEEKVELLPAPKVEKDSLELVPSSEDSARMIVPQNVEGVNSEITSQKRSRQESVRQSQEGASSASEKALTLDDEAQLAKRRKVKISDEETRATAKGLVPLNNKQETGLISSANTEVLMNARERDPNTAFIYCSEAQQIMVSPNATEPSNIALLIPTRVLNASLDRQYDHSLLEVTCNVLTLHMFPMTGR